MAQRLEEMRPGSLLGDRSQFCFLSEPSSLCESNKTRARGGGSCGTLAWALMSTLGLQPCLVSQLIDRLVDG